MIDTVTLNPSLDYVMQVEKVQYEDINRSSKEQFYCGGKGINVSYVLQQLGAKSTALGFLAGFTGRELAARLTQDGIDSDFVYLPNGSTRINVKIQSQPELAFNAQGPQPDGAALQQLLQKLDRLQNGDILVLAGAIPTSLPADTYEQMLKRMDGKGVLTAVDATGEALLRTLPYRPFVIKPNHLELGELFGLQAEDEDTIIRCAKTLQEKGARNVLVSRAEQGALLLDAHGAVHTMANVSGHFVNSVGCGDSMLAGFLAGYQNGGDYEAALRLGIACGNATAYSEWLADKETIDRMLTQQC